MTSFPIKRVCLWGWVLAVLWAVTAGPCHAQFWRMKKPKPPPKEKPKPEEPVPPQEAVPPPEVADPGPPPDEAPPTELSQPEAPLAKAPANWIVTLAGYRVDNHQPIQTKKGARRRPRYSDILFVEIQATRTTPDPNALFLPSWVTVWQKQTGAPQTGGAGVRVHLPRQVTRSNGQRVLGAIKIAEAERLTLQFPSRQAFAPTACGVRFLDLPATPLTAVPLMEGEPPAP